MARYYQGPYWVRGDDDERWATANQRIGWTDDDTRHVARAGDHAWYWSEQQRRHVATDDGLTTTDDIATQLAAGTGGQELAARFWVDAAHLLSDTAWTDLQAVYADVGINQRRREDLTPAERAMVEAAENRADAWGEASNRAATVGEYGSEQAGEDTDAAAGRDHAEAQRIYQVLFDSDYYATIVGDGQTEDSYSDHLWAAAHTHVAMGHTAAGLRAQRSADEAAIPAGPPDERAQREREGPTSAAWRSAVAITYHEHVLDYGNDGRTEDDRHLSASEVAARAMAITTIAAATGVPEGYVFAELRAAADTYGSAPGTDNDPDYLAPPDWDTFADQYQTAEADFLPGSFSADEATGMTAAQLRGEGAVSSDDIAPPVDQAEVRAEARHRVANGDTAATLTRLDTAGDAPRAGLEVPALAPDALAEEPPTAPELEAATSRWPANDAANLSEQSAANELDQSRVHHQETLADEVDRPAHQTRIEQLEADLATGDTTARDAPLSADPVLAEQAAELLRDLDATTDTYPGDDSAYWEAAQAAVDGTVDAIASTALATHETAPAEVTPGGDPVLAADLLDELDQTRARLESGDVHDEDRPHLAELIEQLSERAAEAIIAEAGPQSDQGRKNELADLAAGGGDDGYTPTAQELAERRASSISEQENTALAIGWEHDQPEAQRRGWGAATGPDTQGGNPTYPTAGAVDNAPATSDDEPDLTTEQWLGAPTPNEAARDASRDAQADASSRELAELFNTPDEEPPGKSGTADAVASADEAVQANSHRVAEELDDREPAAHISDAPELAEADAGTGEDPIKRARRAIEHLTAGRAQQAQARQAQASHGQQLSAQHADEGTRSQHSSDGFGWGSGW